jgi:PAS domain-containing protein
VRAAPRASCELPLLIRSGLDTLDFGFAIFDRELALVTWNEAFPSLGGYPAALSEPGTALIEFYRFNA